MLQDKIMKYLANQMVIGNHDAEQQAKDIAEICYKHLSTHSWFEKYEQLEKENKELKESLDNAYGVRDEAIDNQKRLKQENTELKEHINSYKVMQKRWESIAELFEDKIHWGESKSLKTFDLVKELQQENIELKNKLIDFNPTKLLELQDENNELKNKINRLEGKNI